MSLKKSRLEMNLTQEDMARALGITLRAYQGMEKRNDAKVKIALNISTILNKSIEEIFKEN